MSKSSRLTEHDIIDEMHAIAERIGGVPGTEAIDTHASFSLDVLHSLFGSLAGAQLAAGFEPTTVQGLPDELLLNELQTVADDVSGAPTRREFDERSLLTSRGYQSRWGSWNEALQEIGLEPNREPAMERTREDVVRAIEEASEKMGGVPTIDEVVEHTEATDYQLTGRFTAFSILLEEASLESET